MVCFFALDIDIAFFISYIFNLSAPPLVLALEYIERQNLYESIEYATNIYNVAGDNTIDFSIRLQLVESMRQFSFSVLTAEVVSPFRGFFKNTQRLLLGFVCLLLHTT